MTAFSPPPPDSGSPCCKEALRDTLAAHPGIVSASLDPGTQTLRIGYDPTRADARQVSGMAADTAPILQRLLGKCTLRLEGHGCEACAHKLEVSMGERPGVRHATASFIGGVMSLTYDRELTDAAQLLEEARQQGADVTPIETALAEEEARERLRHGTLSERLRYWTRGEALEMVTVALALLTMLAGFFLEKAEAPAAVFWSAYVLSFLCGGSVGAVSAWHSLRQGIVDVDILMFLAALGAAWLGAPFEGAMLLFLFSFSHVLQHYAIDRTRNAIKKLARMKPRQALLLREDGTPEPTDIAQVRQGDHILVRPGDMIPLDGQVLSGESTVDQASVTGESMPVSKHTGDAVFAGTLNQFGRLNILVTRAEKDSTLSRLIQMVEEAQARKAATQRFLEKAEQRYALGVIVFTGALMLLLPLLFGVEQQEAFYRAITVMVVASPCALVISTPASILSAIGNGARRGILFKGGAHLEAASTIRIVAFDKTGTLTHGRPEVVEIEPLAPECSTTSLLQIAATVEAYSEHPLSRAILQHARAQNLQPRPAELFQASVGRGVSCLSEGRRLLAGSPRWFLEMGLDPASPALRKAEDMEARGRTAILIGTNSSEGLPPQAVGVLGLADRIRQDAPALIASLRKMGIQRIIMLTGDSERVAKTVAQECGIGEYYATLLPQDKVHLIKTLAQGEPIAMVGDGTNDAPALAAATTGIAMGAAGSDIALESADIVLMANELDKLRHTLALSRQARRIVLQNLVFAGGIILLMVLATLLLPLIGMSVPLPLGVIAHEGGTVLVCLNGLRLLTYQSP